MPHFNGRRLREIRENRNISRELLGHESGRTARTIALYETGAYCPPSAVLGVMADVLNVGIELFFDSEGPDNVGEADAVMKDIVSGFGKLSASQRRRLSVLLVEPAQGRHRGRGSSMDGSAA